MAECCASCRKWLSAKSNIKAWRGGLYCTMKCIYIAAKANTEKDKKIVRAETETVRGSGIGID